MIKHVVVAGAAPHATSEDIDALLAGWRALSGQIPEIETLDAGRNLGLMGARNTVAAVAEFASVDAWERFMAHPSHADFREKLGSRFLDSDTFSIVQFEC